MRLMAILLALAVVLGNPAEARTPRVKRCVTYQQGKCIKWTPSKPAPKPTTKPKPKVNPEAPKNEAPPIIRYDRRDLPI